MSKTTDLLQSAIADAKLVREAAMLNAQKSIEESFAPHLKNMISAKIQEMDEQELNEAEGDDLRGTLKGLGTESEIEAYIEKVKSDVESYHGWYSDDFIEDFKYWLQDKTDSALEENESLEEDFDLEGFLQEMENEDIPSNPTDPNDNLVCESEDEEDEETEDEGEDKEDEEDDEEIDLENLTEDDLKEFIEGVISDMVEAGELESNEDLGDGEGDDESLDFDLEDETGEAADEEALNEVKKELNEAKKQIKSLQESIQKTNLLNSKLLYSNRIFKNKVLSESKKDSVLNAFEKANTIDEVKMTYKLLNENITSSKTKSNPLIKGFASQSMVLKENKIVKPILAEDAIFSRMKKLAGIN